MSGVKADDLLDARALLVAIVDPAGRVRAWNEALVSHTGLSAEAVRGTPCERWVTLRDRPRFLEALGRARAGEAVLFEGYWLSQGGLPRWLALAVEPRPLPGGQVEVALLGLDRTEPERTRESLRDSEAKFAGIISIAADAIISVDETQRIVVFNAGAEKIFGWSAAEILGQPLDLLLPERYRARHRVEMETFAHGPVVARKMGERQVDVWGLRKSGEEFPAEASISKLEISGRMLLTAAMRDVTERRAVEAEQRFLAEVGARLGGSLDPQETLVTVTMLAVPHLADFCVADLLEGEAQLRRVAVAHAAPVHAAAAERLRQILLEPEGASLGATALRRREPLLVSELDQGVLEAITQDPEHLAAMRALSPRSLIATPLFARGRALGVLLFGAVTRSYGEDSLRQAKELASRASAAIENARLFEAAQQALRGRDEVLRVVAHDLRNPLNAIGLSAHGLAKGGLDPAGVQKRAEGILRSSARMGRMIEDLLDVARIEAGKLALARAALSPDELLEAMIEAERPLALAAGLSLELTPGGSLPQVRADRDRLGQVLENLIGNAIKFTPAGGRITVEAKEAPGEVVFSVADTGVGIPPEQEARLFDRFWQARPTDRRGAGLGLAICKGIVEGHGGRIWVASTPGQGSTFSFSVPTTQAEENLASS
jgi:PAS domain S-box-containing protein